MARFLQEHKRAAFRISPISANKAMRLMNIAYTFLVIYRNHLAYFTAVNYIFKGNKERCVTENRAYYNFNIVFL